MRNRGLCYFVAVNSAFGRVGVLMRATRWASLLDGTYATHGTYGSTSHLNQRLGYAQRTDTYDSDCRAFGLQSRSIEIAPLCVVPSARETDRLRHLLPKVNGKQPVSQN